MLNSFSGLENLQSIELNLSIFDRNVTNLSGFTGLNSIGGSFSLSGFPCLTNLNGLESLTAIGNNFRIHSNHSLNDLSGLNNLQSIGGGLAIYNNDSLKNFSGLNNLQSIGGGLAIHENHKLNNLDALYNLTGIGGELIIYNNLKLTSIFGLANINSGTISFLRIYENHILSECNVESVCDYLADPEAGVEIRYNGVSCGSADQIRDHCITGIKDLKPDLRFVIAPNPASTKISLSVSELPENCILNIINMRGQSVINRAITEDFSTIDISGLPAGLYLVKITGKHFMQLNKLAKK